jgi:predicted RNA-binding Zn ribbon-like protein
VLSVNVRDLERIGGAVCLDFVNTVDPRYVTDRIEYVPDYDALLEWSVDTGLLDRSSADRLGEIARHRPQMARAVHRRALALREALFELLRKEPGPDRAASLEMLNAELARSRTQQVVERAIGGFESAWPASTALDRVLWPIASSAANLLTSPRLGRVRECAGERCGCCSSTPARLVDAAGARWRIAAIEKAKRRRATRDASVA